MFSLLGYDSQSLWVAFILFGVLISTAFSTLFERKILAMSQRRNGPNKSSLKGMLQPLTDALKLLTKQMIKPYRLNMFSFIFFPCLALGVSLFLWLVWPQWISSYYIWLGILFYLSFSSFHVYSIIFSGWSSNSSYSMLGSIRALAQSISFEVCLAGILFFIAFMKGSFDLLDGVEFGLDFYYSFMFLFFFLPFFLIWLVIGAVELHRSPFDLSEAESELVSGYNTDYSSFGFVLLFISEYSNVIFLGQLTSFFWISTYLLVSINLGTCFSCLFLFFRAAYPRVKYNDLMSACWKMILPIIFLFLTLTFFFTLNNGPY